jgi:hypothetical protein
VMDDVFAAVLERAPAQRAFLAQECGGDAE